MQVDASSFFPALPPSVRIPFSLLWEETQEKDISHSRTWLPTCILLQLGASLGSQIPEY